MVAVALLGGAPPAPKVEPVPCWRTLFMDWADGRVTGTYSAGCYRTAIARTQGDRLVYGSAGIDLRLLRDRSVARLRPDQRVPLKPSTLLAPWPARRDAGGIGSTWTSEDGWRIALAAVLTGLLAVWTVVRLRRS
jgi:hypothetical protein